MFISVTSRFFNPLEISTKMFSCLHFKMSTQNLLLFFHYTLLSALIGNKAGLTSRAASCRQDHRGNEYPNQRDHSSRQMA